MRHRYATAVMEPVGSYYPDVREQLADLDNQLDTLRSLYSWADAKGRLELRESAQALQEERTRKQFRLNRHEEEVIAERYSLDDNKDYDSTLPQTDEEWLSWKVNKFIKNIAHRTAKGSLYIGKVRVRNVEDGYFEFRCYAQGCKFHARHSIVNGAGEPDRKRVELRIGRILAHWYKH